MEKEFYDHYSATDFVLDEDFVAWVKGTDPQAGEQWETWLLEHPEKQEAVEAARQILLSLSFSTQSIGGQSLDEEWSIIRDSTINIPEESIFETEREPRRLWPAWMQWVAASVVLLLVGWVGKNYLYTSTPDLPVYSEKQALNGQQLTIKLTDGTVIVLNAGSTLWYPEQFAADKREVKLRGEAYFEVAPNPKAPFLIFTDDVRVEVIGTKFTVKAYPENREVKVAVVEGKVAVDPAPEKEAGQEAESQGIMLVRNEMATIEKVNREYKVTPYDENDLLGWKNGVLYFQKADFQQIVKKLERWYGVQIELGEGVAMDSTWRFSGKFENKSIDYILDVCRYPNRFSYKLTDNKVYINK